MLCTRGMTDLKFSLAKNHENILLVTDIIDGLTESLILKHCRLWETPTTVETVFSNEFILLLK